MNHFRYSNEISKLHCNPCKEKYLPLGLSSAFSGGNHHNFFSDFIPGKGTSELVVEKCPRTCRRKALDAQGVKILKTSELQRKDSRTRNATLYQNSGVFGHHFNF